MNSGMLPIPPEIANDVLPADGYVVAEYRAGYRCAKCGWRPDSDFGCIPAMERHIRDVHGYADKPLWLAAYSDKQIKDLIAISTNQSDEGN